VQVEPSGARKSLSSASSIASGAKGSSSRESGNPIVESINFDLEKLICNNHPFFGVLIEIQSI